MFKIKRLLKGMLRANPYLAPIINKSRIFNSYMTIVEIGMIVFQIAIAGRTNQSGMVFHFIVQSVIAIIAQNYVHVNFRLPYFEQAIKYIIIAQAYMCILFSVTLNRFIALNTACSMINNYYSKLEGEAATPKAFTECTFTRIVYLVWFILIIAVSVMRFFGFMLMMRTRKFLRRKLAEKEKRKLLRFEKKKKEKRNKKRNLQNTIQEKQNIYMTIQQRLMKNLRRLNDLDPDSDHEAS